MRHWWMVVLGGLLVLWGCTGEDPEQEDEAGSGYDDPSTVFDASSPDVPTPGGVVSVTLPDGFVVDAAADELLLAIDLDINEARLAAIMDDVADADCVVVGSLPRSRMLLLDTGRGADLAPLIERFQVLDGVLNVAPNLLMSQDSDHSPDPFDFDEWIDDVRASDGWDRGTGSLEVKVATVDSGFDLDMDLIVDERVERLDFLGLPVVLDDNDGSASSHGTYTTSLAAADGGDGIDDAVGACWECAVLSVDVDTLLSGVYSVFASTTVAGIETALEGGADVVNVSLGAVLSSAMEGTSENFLLNRQLWRETITPAVDAARRDDALVVFSAGNDGEGMDANHLPGGDNHVPGVTVYDDDRLLPEGSQFSENAWVTSALIVSASRAGTAFDQDLAPLDRAATFSRRGDVVGIAAPGEDVGVGDGANLDGTSFSAPIVAGAAALAWSENAGEAGLIASEVRQILVDTANAAVLSGVGLLDMGRAMEVAESSASVPVFDPIELELEQGQSEEQEIEFTFTGAVGLDILFLIDTSGSFGDDIDTLQASAGVIIDEVSSLGENVQFGVASFADFPLGDFGSPADGDEAYVLRQSLTTDLEAVFDALDTLDQPLNVGGDGPESQLEALFQAASGAGRDVDGDGDYDDVGEIAPGLVGFRPDAVKIIIMATDAPFHGYSSEPDYPGATLEETMTALTDAHIIVVGLDSGDTQGHLQHVVDQTGGMLFDLSYDSAEIAESVYEGVFLTTQEMDISVMVVNDPEGFVESVTPEMHYGVETGDTVTFQVAFEGVLDQPVADLEFFSARLWIMGNGGILARIPLQIQVPDGP